MNALKEVIREYKADGGSSEVAKKAAAELAALTAELEAVKRERDAYKDALLVLSNYKNYATDGDLKSEYQGVHVSDFSAAALKAGKA